MNKYNQIATALIAISVCTSCATTEEAQQREQEKQRTIEQILSEPLDAAEYGENQRCLSNYRHVRILDDQTLVFEGRGKKLWLNQLPMRCPGLHRGSVLQVRKDFAIERICKMDTVTVSDWFDWPWYRRSPWRWTSGVRCSLGEFQPVTKLQVQALKAAISQK